MAGFTELLQGGQFALTTVFDAKVYAFPADYDPLKSSPVFFTVPSGEPKCTLDTLKVSNINAEGPTLTITGGRNDDTLLKRGKKYRLEMQDALGNFKALEAFGYGKVKENQFNITPDFAGDLTIVGITDMIDRTSGETIECEIVIPRFKADSITNLSMDAGGDATVFDLNGDISSVKLNATDEVFYYFKAKGE
jgi:hypothetical protein